MKKSTKNPREDGLNWYFIYEGRFEIVHKNHWHLNHTLMDSHISSRVILPEGFEEVEESIFEFEGSPRRGLELLSAANFSKLERPYYWDSALYIASTDDDYRFYIICDSPAIRKVVAKLPINEKITHKSYLGLLRKAARENEWSVITTSKYSDTESLGLAILPRGIYESLPRALRHWEWI